MNMHVGLKPFPEHLFSRLMYYRAGLAAFNISFGFKGGGTKWLSSVPGAGGGRGEETCISKPHSRRAKIKRRRGAANIMITPT